MRRESNELLVGTTESVNGVFCACGTVRLLLGFDGAGTARQPPRQRKRIIAETVRFENRRRITVELTRRRESIPIHRDRRSLRNMLPPLASNDLFGSVPCLRTDCPGRVELQQLNRRSIVKYKRNTNSNRWLGRCDQNLPTF